MDSNSIYKKVEQYVEDLFEENSDDTLIFHNLHHTKTVVSRTKEIAGHYNISERDMLVLYIAAWFHDTGHLFTKPVGHEDKSVELVNAFMRDHFNDEELMHAIDNCILATKAPRNPANLLEEIICDADTYHFGTKEFKETNKQVLKEIELKTGYVNHEQELKSALKMLEEHKFYTAYCREILSETKQKNIKKVKKKLSEMNEQNGKKIQATNNKEEAKVRKSLVIEKEKDLATKGIQTMLRITSENQVKLSDMADHKANILISVNAIIISVILGVLMRRLQEDIYLTIPTVVFLLVAVITIVIAILATRPKINSGTFSSQDVLDKKTNLMFFGNFHRASYEEYDTAMRKMMKDADYVYSSIIKDIYYLGVVLGRKYRLIRLAYNIFMIGIILSVVAFGIAALFHAADSSSAVSTGATSPL